MNKAMFYSAMTVSQEEVAAGIERLSVLMQGNRDKVKEIIFLFTSETPILIEQISHAIRNSKGREAARVIHRLKPRYGYIGLDRIMKALAEWEESLTRDLDTDSFGTLQKYEQVNDLIMDALTSSEYCKENGSDHVKLASPPKLILIAEDDEVNAKIFELLITEAGLSVIIANDGSQAVNLTCEKSPDLIFMDVHMPYFSGLYAIRDLRHRGIMCPIVALSASTGLDEKKNSIAAGANDFLRKPARRDAIMNMLSMHLS